MTAAPERAAGLDLIPEIALREHLVRICRSSFPRFGIRLELLELRLILFDHLGNEDFLRSLVLIENLVDLLGAMRLKQVQQVQQLLPLVYLVLHLEIVPQLLLCLLMLHQEVHIFHLTLVVLLEEGNELVAPLQRAQRQAPILPAQVRQYLAGLQRLARVQALDLELEPSESCSTVDRTSPQLSRGLLLKSALL